MIPRIGDLLALCGALIVLRDRTRPLEARLQAADYLRFNGYDPRRLPSLR